MKRILSFLIILTILCTVFVSSTLSSAAAFAKTPFSRTNIPAQLKVTASALNVRSGPSTYFKVVGLVYKNQIVDCIGKLGDWYIIHLNNDTVGVASGKYLKPYYPPTNQPAPKPTPKPPNTDTPAPSPDGEISQEEQKMLDLINAERAKTGAQPLKMDKEVARVAQIKAQDMVDRNYFSHTSPTYGSPFEMLKKFGISYRYAGENLAGNSTVERAHTSLMNSEGHRKNILNPNYNYVGIGIVNSPKYGKIFVQMFIGK
ncbi:MAG: hypothetical protein PWP27_515 [Clostridiales bacterium]|jgi:uncharacterized YkwD family protein|nr:hypothetical protein [Clostridiales bacterium]